MFDLIVNSGRGQRQLKSTHTIWAQLMAIYIKLSTSWNSCSTKALKMKLNITKVNVKVMKCPTLCWSRRTWTKLKWKCFWLHERAKQCKVAAIDWWQALAMCVCLRACVSSSVRCGWCCWGGWGQVQIIDSKGNIKRNEFWKQ